MSTRQMLQPNDGRSGELLSAELGAGRWTDLLMAVAFARKSGLRHLDAPLRAFAARGGRIRAALGYDFYGTSFDAVSQLMGAVGSRGSVALVHDGATPPTFHPKCFAFLNRSSARARPTEALVVTGSSNLTEAALYVNDEALSVWEPDLPGEQAALDQFLQSLNGWVRPAGTQRRTATASLLGTLHAAGDLKTEAELATTSSAATAAGGLPLRRRQRTARRRPPRARPMGTPAVPIPATPSRPPASPTAGGQILSWTKTLSASDAQHPPSTNSSPKGWLTLTESGHNINHRRWFRRTMFSSARWVSGTTRTGRPLEIAIVPMDVTIAAGHLGAIDIRIDHAPHREAGQGNVPTVLHWGSVIGALMRATNYKGRVVEISRSSTGFKLEVR